MLSVIITLIFFVCSSKSSDGNQRTAEVVSALLTEPNCPGTVVAFDRGIDSKWASQHRLMGDDGLLNTFIRQNHLEPVTLLELADLTDDDEKQNFWEKELVCQTLVIFSSESTNKLAHLYGQIKRRFFIKTAVIVGQFSSEESTNFLLEIQNENLFVVLEKPGSNLEVYTWKTNKRVILNTLTATASNADIMNLKASHNDFWTKLTHLHLSIGTLSYPPFIFIDSSSGFITGIEPSLLAIIADHLQFTYDYVQVSPSEMWGEIFVSDYNVSFTGLMQFLASKKVDVAVGQLYVSSIRWPYIGYSVVYKFSYESFLVPAPQPYAKWTALIYSFTLPTWLATIFSTIVVVIMLRLVAAYSLDDDGSRKFHVFGDLQYCCLYVIGNLSNVQMQPQSITSNVNRMFLIWWLFGTLILTTGYRSGLISYMTFPFTPPAIDTLQQLVDSPLRKGVFGGFLKSILVNGSVFELERQLGEQLVPYYNLSQMYSLLETGSWAVQSNLYNLLYVAATLYPPSNTTHKYPKVHLIKDAILPVQVAFGLQKDSQLKPYFDRVIYSLIESGLVSHHTMSFVSRMDNWNPSKKANDVRVSFSFSLDSLQGAFFLFGAGLTISILAFIVEIAFFTFQVRKSKKIESRSLEFFW